VLGICKLCLVNKDLRKSHLVPRSLYKKVRTRGAGNNEPGIRFVNGRTGRSSHQFQDCVLCAECEHRFNVNGEDYVMRLTLRDGRLPLLEMLERARTTAERDGLKAYSTADTPEVEREKLAYFGISVFWRASVHTWHDQDGNPLRIELGNRYNEEIRRYLLGSAPPPPLAYLAVHVCTDELHRHIFYPPCRNIKHASKIFEFLACGIRFTFGIGKSFPDLFRDSSILKRPNEWITSFDCRKEHVKQLIAKRAN
jgi:hypothetical protein